jgi:hypothetical protein
MPSNGLDRDYFCAKYVRSATAGFVVAGSSAGELCVFNADTLVFRATLPVSCGGVLSLAATTRVRSTRTCAGHPAPFLVPPREDEPTSFPSLPLGALPPPASPFPYPLARARADLCRTSLAVSRVASAQDSARVDAWLGVILTLPAPAPNPRSAPLPSPAGLTHTPRHGSPKLSCATSWIPLATTTPDHHSLPPPRLLPPS